MVANIEQVEQKVAAARTMAKKPTRKPKHQQREKLTGMGAVVAAFNGCGRCSFFLAGYKVLYQDLETAVKNSRSGWLELTWDKQARELVHKSYGIRFDTDLFYCSGSCRECGRTFIYCAPEDETQPPLFRIESGAE